MWYFIFSKLRNIKLIELLETQVFLIQNRFYLFPNYYQSVFKKLFNRYQLQFDFLEDLIAYVYFLSEKSDTTTIFHIRAEAGIK